MTAGFRLEGLTLRDAGGAVRVAEVSLAAGPGEALLLVGETGAGKSLIARAMLGLLPPGFAASGTLRFGDLPPIGLDRPEAVRRHWSGRTLFLPQEPRAALDPTMRVGAHLAWATPPANPLAALAAVGLPPATARLYPFALSGGMAQRVLVATALATTAPVVVVDEPTKGLDPARMHQVSALLRRLLAEGRSLLVITHDIGLVRRLGGEMAMVRDGRVVERGRAEAMLAAPRHPYMRGWAQADPAPWARPPPGPQAAAVLAGHALTAGHGGRPLFRGLDVAVRPGAVLGVAGPSGTGKTTLGNVLVGLLRPLAGRVAWQGHDPYADRTARRRLRQRFQKLHQDPATAFAPHRTLGQQMRDLEEVVPGLDTATALPPLLDRLDLAPALLGRRPADVSGGEAQRMAIARLLLLDPLVVVADEPTSRLDPLTQQRTMALLRDTLQARGVGLVLIGHDRRVLGAATDDVLVLGAP